MIYNETVTFKHSKEVREAMRILKAEYLARKKLKLLANGEAPGKVTTPSASTIPQNAQDLNNPEVVH
jgi:hypothetical protein